VDIFLKKALEKLYLNISKSNIPKICILNLADNEIKHHPRGSAYFNRVQIHHYTFNVLL